MAEKALVSGSDPRATALSDALRDVGFDVITVTDVARLHDAVAELQPRSLQCYVQLPVQIDVAGSSVVSRVHSFLKGGLLARFDAADAVLPALADDARVVLVAGNTPTEGADVPDDRAARFAMLGVLAHAIRAEKAPAKLRVRMVDGGQSPQDIAAVALGQSAPVPVPAAVAQLQSREAEMSYEDWRAEVMGLATIEV